MKLKIPNFIPCFIHNLSNYDSHFIVRELRFIDNEIKVISNREKKCISYSKYVNNTFTVRFIDTYTFLASSLAILAPNLITLGCKKFW